MAAKNKNFLKSEFRNKQYWIKYYTNQIFYFIPNRFLALLIQIGFAILFFSSNAIWDLIGIEEIENEIEKFRIVSNVIGAVLAVMAVYELVKIYLQFRVYGAIKKEENQIE